MYEKSMGIFCVGCEPKDVEEIRRYRTIKAEVKADRLLAKADRLDAEAERRAAPLEAMRGDTAFFTQPGRIAYRDRIFQSYDKSGELAKEAKETRERAEGIMKDKTRVAGDAERRRQAEREALDSVLGKGSRVHDFCFGDGEIVSVHKKSYRIKFDSGGTYARDKTYVRPIKQS
jgi:predicted GNAT superfamily acetyltransferase